MSARGRYFNTNLPNGHTVPLNDPASFSNIIEVEKISGRDPSGKKINNIFFETLNSDLDKFIVAHSVDCGKTGVQLSLINKGDAQMWVVDAAQGRFSIQSLNNYLVQGACVILTGSKFFSGPSFCGCVLMPKKFSKQLEKSKYLEAFNYYLSRADIPVDILKESAVTAANRGLLLRWEGALSEMERYTSIEPSLAEYRVYTIRTEILSHIGKNPNLILLENQDCATIISFEVLNRSYEDLQKIHRQMTDPTQYRSYSLGAPVMITNKRSALRIAISAAQISDFDKSNWESDLDGLFRKLFYCLS